MSEAITNDNGAVAASVDLAPPSPKKRGRPLMPRDANGNIIRNGSTTASATPKSKAKKADDVPELITNEEVADAIDGAFLMTSVALGPHWGLLPDEKVRLGKAFGPLFRRYPQHVEKYVDLLVLAPAAASVIVPRIKVSSMAAQGHIPAGKEIEALLTMKAGLRAKEHINIEAMAREIAKEVSEEVQPQATMLAQMDLTQAG